MAATVDFTVQYHHAYVVSQLTVAESVQTERTWRHGSQCECPNMAATVDITVQYHHAYVASHLTTPLTDTSPCAQAAHVMLSRPFLINTRLLDAPVSQDGGQDDVNANNPYR